MDDQTKHKLITIVIPAAGHSSRMGGTDKLTLPVNNSTLLRSTVQKALASLAGEIVVVIRKTQQIRIKETNGLDVKLVHPKSRKNEMSVSVISGLNASHASSAGILILLPDMPLVETSDINLLIDKFHPEKIIRASNAKGEPGHPVLFPRRFFSEIHLTTGDYGPREVIANHKNVLELVKLDNERALVDLDTPESWARWLSDHNGGAGEGT